MVHLRNWLVSMLVLSSAVGCSDIETTASTRFTTPSASTAALTTAAGGIRTAVPVEVLTWPGAQCSLYASGDRDKATPIAADDQGIVLFSAIPATAGDPIVELNLDCTDDADRQETYPLDLTSSSTFEAIPSEQLVGGGPVRPALTGDPMQYSQQYLLQTGYGLRPDPSATRSGYARWLQAMSVPARRVDTRDGKSTQRFDTEVSHSWGGGEFRNDTYVVIDYTLTVPTVQPHEDGGFGLWGGLGGADGDTGLIQSGLAVLTGSNYVQYSTFKQYAGVKNGEDGYEFAINLFTVSAADVIYGQAWACDVSGNVNASGGYGCYYVQDTTKNVFKNCSTPSSSCPSLAQLHPFVGGTAESILEDSDSFLANYGTAEISSIVQCLHCGSGSGSGVVEFSTANPSNVRTLDLRSGFSGAQLQEVAVDDPAPDGTTFVWEQTGP